MNLKIKRLNNFAGFDIPAYPGDAGYDVYSTISIMLRPLERIKIPLGIAIELPKGYVARVEGKSGNAIRFGLTTIGNIVDSSYRGEVHAIVVNVSQELFYIARGMKIAQLIFQKINNPIPTFVLDLSQTARGTKGFGSTSEVL